MLSRFSISVTWAMYCCGADDFIRTISGVKISTIGCADGGMCDLSPLGYCGLDAAGGGGGVAVAAFCGT